MTIAIVMNFFTMNAYAKETQEWETPSGISSEKIESVCDKAFQDSIGNSIAGGAIVIVKDGKIVFEKGYGYADIKNQIFVDPKTTIFEYGSVTKLFTWTSVMQLAEEGKLDLNVDIRKYLPHDFKLNTNFSKAITMMNLMNHQAGFDDYLIHLFSKPNELADLKSSLYENQVDQVHEPGFAMSYSNYSAALAGYIVECISGEPMYQYVQNHIFQIAGMEHATLNPNYTSNNYVQKYKSLSYNTDGNGKLTKANWSYVPLYPAGSANGTIEELSKFGIALCNEDVNPVLFKNKNGVKNLLSTSYCANKEVSGIAHGFIEYDGEYETYWHNGGTENFSTFFAVVPSEDYAIALVANTANGISTIQKLGFQTVQKKDVVLEKPQKNLPNTKIVQGKYMDFRQVHHGITQLFYLFPEALDIKAVNNTQISINGDLYTQIKPYLYQNVKTGIKGTFVVESGKVVKYSNMIDYIPVTWEQKVKQYITYAILACFLLSFLVQIVYLFGTWIRNRIHRKERVKIICLKEKKWAIFSIVCYLLLFTNIYFVVNKILTWERFSIIRLNIVINYGFGAFILIASGFIIFFLRQNKSRLQRFIYGSYGISSVIMLVTLGVWGIFNFMK